MPEDVLLHYCLYCGAPVGAYTLYLPFEHIRGWGDFMARCARASLRGNGMPWFARVLGVAVVLIVFPLVFLLLPLRYLGRRETSAESENTVTDSASS